MNQGARPCPGENTLAALVDGDLDADHIATVGAHLDTCEHCRALMVALAPREDPTPARRVARGTEPPPIAARIGRYQLGAVLGRGGMGLVYDAYDPELDRAVALKVVRPELARVGEIRERLLREARAQARLSHPNVVAIYDAGSDGDQVFIAMERIDGVTLGRWLERERPGVRRIARVFRDAARGLGAAHAAGLVHRDFKPDNALIDGGDRVRVADFGLARGGGTSGSIAGSADVAITRDGVAVGTPAYMAPEQHDGGEVDARSDVWSLSAALFEAVHGERPFAGATAAEIAERARAGELTTTDAGAPRWLRKLLARGLDPDPARRPASMDEVVAAIDRGLAGRRRLIAAGAGAALIAGGVALALALPASSPPSCEVGDRALAGAWDDARKAEVRAALEADGAVGAERWHLVEDGLDRWARGWKSVRADHCRASRDGRLSGPMLDRREVCLDNQLATVRGQTALLASGDPAVADYALELLSSLPSPERCTAAWIADAHVPEPGDADTRAEVERVRAELVKAEVLHGAGRSREAVAMLEPMVEPVRELGYRPLEAELLYVLGTAMRTTASPQACEETLRRAAAAAQAGRHDHIAVSAWTDLVELTAMDTGDYEAARRYAELADAAIERIGGDRESSALLAMNRGALYLVTSDLDAARAELERALELAPDDAIRLEVKTRLGLVLVDAGELDAARAMLEGVLAARLASLPPRHPDVGLAHTNVANVLMAEGEFAAALEHLRTALAIDEAVFGPEHIDTARTRHNVAMILDELGRRDEAQALHQRALATVQRVQGAHHRDAAQMMVGMAESYTASGDAERAVDLLRKAIAIYQARADDDSFDLARAQINLGDALREAGELDEALTVAHQGLRTLEAATGGETGYSGYGWTGIGRVLLDSGKPARAIEPLEKASRLYRAAGIDGTEVAVAELALAQAVWRARSDRERAIELADGARATFAANPGRTRELADTEAFLRAIR